MCSIKTTNLGSIGPGCKSAGAPRLSPTYRTIYVRNCMDNAIIRRVQDMKKNLFISILILFLFGCASVTINKSPSADFSNLKKIAIMDISNNVGSYNFSKMLEGELISKDLQIVDASNSDVIIEVSYSYIFIARILKRDTKELLATIQSSGPDPMVHPDAVSRLTAKRIGQLFLQ